LLVVSDLHVNDAQSCRKYGYYVNWALSINKAERKNKEESKVIYATFIINYKLEACEKVDDEYVSQHNNIEWEVSGLLNYVKDDQWNNNLARLNISYIYVGTEDCFSFLADFILNFRGVFLIFFDGFEDK
jgi:hypothetical protein